jgi:hypothetical protein
MTKVFLKHTQDVLLLLLPNLLPSLSFSIGSHAHKKRSHYNFHHLSSVTDNIDQDNVFEVDEILDKEDFIDGPTKISSPLKLIGPYPSLSLHFPKLATSSQRKREVSGISLDFVLDTAANTNTINAQVAAELDLENVGSALPGYNAAGSMDGASTYLLGECTLDLPEKELFMMGLTASALPVASPAAAGLLGVGFLNCFQGGVRFDWGNNATVTFYGDSDGMEEETHTMIKAPIEVIKDVLLPSVILKVNGKEIRALLDTGSPITVLNSAAAKVAGLDTVQISKGQGGIQESKGNFLNPFQKIMNNVKDANAQAQAAARGDILIIAGAAGQAVQLVRTENEAQLCIAGLVDDINFPSSKVYVGDLPGLAALGGLNGVSSPPAAVLGMDVLTRKSSMLYRADEVYFS